MTTDPLAALLAEKGLDVRTGEPLARRTTIRIGGPARLTVLPRDAGELAALLTTLRDTSDAPPVLVLGGGANCFADSEGLDAAVVSLENWREPFALEADGLFVVSGGARMRDAAEAAARAGWGGVDWMAVVPGAVGGAVVINAGTNTEGCVADRFLWCETVDPAGRVRRRTADEMAFGYRTSRLLHGREIVVRAAFEVIPADAEALIADFEAKMALRAEKFPLDFPNFGSTFRSPGAPHPPAGKLIDELGLKGLRAGGAQISERHANFIVNRGEACSEDVLALMTRMHDAVREAFGVSLRPEVHYLCDADRPRPAFFPPLPQS